MSLKPGTRIGKYVVTRKLAEGGMAELFLCCSRGPEGFEKDVVIKRIRPPYAKEPAFVDMFISEAKVAARFSHQNLVQIFDFSVDEDTFSLVMEYVRGKSLVEVRNHSRQMLVPIPPILVAQIGAQIANGLQHAHELHKGGRRIGIVHRDVTPHNVLLSFDGSVKLTDFGIAKSGDKLTVAGQLKGKFGYMSPEQAEGAKDVDSRSDIFSLGVVLWELLTGGRLFVGDSDMAIVRSVRESVIPSPARLNPDVPEDIDVAVMKALSRDRTARFGTAGELGRALAQSVLHHANTVEEHDIAVFLARLFPEEVLAYRSGAPHPEVSGSGVSTTSGAKTDAEEPSEWISFKSLLNVDVNRTEAAAGNADTLVAPGEHRNAAAKLLPDQSTTTTLAGLSEQWTAAADPANRTTLINFSSRPAVVFVRRLVSAIVAVLSKTVAPIPRQVWAGLIVFVMLASLTAVGIRWSRSRNVDPRPTSLVAQPRDSSFRPALANPAEDEKRSNLTLGQEKPEELAAPASSQPEFGTLVLKVAPWALVSIDGERRGEVTGTRRIRLAAGKHRVKLWHPRGSRELSVTIRQGEELVRQHQVLLPAQSSVAPNIPQ